MHNQDDRSYRLVAWQTARLAPRVRLAKARSPCNRPPPSLTLPPTQDNHKADRFPSGGAAAVFSRCFAKFLHFDVTSMDDLMGCCTELCGLLSGVLHDGALHASVHHLALTLRTGLRHLCENQSLQKNRKKVYVTSLRPQAKRWRPTA